MIMFLHLHGESSCQLSELIIGVELANEPPTVQSVDIVEY